MGFFSDGSGSPFAHFWVTDSCPLTIKAIENRAPFEVLSLAASIAEALQIQKGHFGRKHFIERIGMLVATKEILEENLKAGGICDIL